MLRMSCPDVPPRWVCRIDCQPVNRLPGLWLIIAFQTQSMMSEMKWYFLLGKKWKTIWLNKVIKQDKRQFYYTRLQESNIAFRKGKTTPAVILFLAWIMGKRFTADASTRHQWVWCWPTTSMGGSASGGNPHHQTGKRAPTGRDWALHTT